MVTLKSLLLLPVSLLPPSTGTAPPQPPPSCLQPKEEVVMSGVIRTAGAVRATLLSGLLKIPEVSGEPTVQTIISPLFLLWTSWALSQTAVCSCVVFQVRFWGSTDQSWWLSLHNSCHHCHFISCTLWRRTQQYNLFVFGLVSLHEESVLCFLKFKNFLPSWTMVNFLISCFLYLNMLRASSSMLKRKHSLKTITDVSGEAVKATHTVTC